jgi:ABC-2 type transport system permease protein
MAMGARPRGGVLGVLLVFFVVGLVGGAFAAVSNSLALVTRTQRVMVSVVNFISLPLIFLSTMMISRNLMPGWIRVLAAINPIDWAVTVSRAAFNGSFDAWMLRPLGLLVAITGVAWLVALRSLIRYQRSS